MGEKGQWETRSGRTKNVGAMNVGVGERARVELIGESGGVDEGERVGELSTEDMAS